MEIENKTEMKRMKKIVRNYYYNPSLIDEIVRRIEQTSIYVQ